jgi:glutamate carboxypeptidase
MSNYWQRSTKKLLCVNAMLKRNSAVRLWQALSTALVFISLSVTAQTSTKDSATHAKVAALAKAESKPALETIARLVEIESGSRDLEGLAKIEGLIANQLRGLGMQVDILPASAPEFHPSLKGAKLGNMVYGRLKGKGTKRILLIAHMDTVYLKGMGAAQPFRVEGERAYGLGISDDKGGVGLILHTVSMLRQLNFDAFGELAVLINGDEEIGSPGSAPTLVKLGAEYDAVYSFEGGGNPKNDHVRLATSSIAIATLKVTGRASHAGANPEGGRNALYELAHQIMQTRQLGNAAKGLKINWTVAQAGAVRNVIPASAEATADIRALANEDLDEIEAALRKAIENKLIPDTQVELNFLRSRPAFKANPASLATAKHAATVYQEIGKELKILERATGGGTDAAFVAINAKGAVLESFGTLGFGAHSNDHEYIFIESLESRLYLATRMVMDMAQGLIVMK